MIAFQLALAALTSSVVSSLTVWAGSVVQHNVAYADRV